MLQISNLQVTYSRWSQTVDAVRGLSLTVAPGEMVLLTGPNGSGKSSVLNVVSRRIPYQGSVKVGGREVSTMSRKELAARVFHVHQSPLLGTAPGLTLQENLRLATEGAQIRVSPAETKSWLESLGLESRLKQPVENLSGGERQLLSFLIARLRGVPLLLLDEPFASLDPARLSQSQAEIARMHEAGSTIILTTHDQQQIREHRGRIVELSKGRLAGTAVG